MSFVYDSEKVLCILGTGGFAREVLCLLLDVNPMIDLKKDVFFLKKDSDLVSNSIMGVSVQDESFFDVDKHQLVIGIGDPVLRKKVFNSYANAIYPNLIHPRATLSPWVRLGSGVLITAGVVITCNVEIGNQTQLNLNSTIGHDTTIGDFVTVSPGCNVSGECEISSMVYLGTNSSLKQGVAISQDVIVGMGAAVLKNITEPGIYIGIPAQKRKQ